MTVDRQARHDAARLWRLCLVNGSLDEARVRRVVDEVIMSKHSRGAAVLSRFLRLLKLDRDRCSARADSAVPLDDQTRAAVAEGLAHKYGPAITVSFGVDPTLIAGMRVKIGSDVYDGSVKAGLAALEARF